jgi:hypothetical protein
MIASNQAGGESVENRITNPVKAIRAKCLECSCGSSNEVTLCSIPDCALYPFRFGKNPYRSKRELTDEQKEIMTKRLLNRPTSAAGAL